MRNHLFIVLYRWNQNNICSSIQAQVELDLSLLFLSQRVINRSLAWRFPESLTKHFQLAKSKLGLRVYIRLVLDSVFTCPGQLSCNHTNSKNNSSSSISLIQTMSAVRTTSSDSASYDATVQQIPVRWISQLVKPFHRRDKSLLLILILADILPVSYYIGSCRLTFIDPDRCWWLVKDNIQI